MNEKREELLAHKIFLKSWFKNKIPHKKDLYEANDSQLKILLKLLHWIVTKEIPISKAVYDKFRYHKKLKLLKDHFLSRAEFLELFEGSRRQHLQILLRLLPILKYAIDSLK